MKFVFKTKKKSENQNIGRGKSPGGEEILENLFSTPTLILYPYK
jgi:hypothetical protein